MKELREYQQSEAYKMCTEKIQEKKIKKGGLRGWGSCPLLGGGVSGRLVEGNPLPPSQRMPAPWR